MFRLEVINLVRIRR